MKNLKSLICAAFIFTPTVSLAEWSGPYAGLSYGISTKNEIEVSNDDASATLEIDTDGALGVFGGYRFETSGFVFGGEVAYSKASLSVEDGDAEAVDSDGTTLDLKGMVGYDLNGFLVYGVAGLSNTDVEDDFGSEKAKGYNFGVGGVYSLENGIEFGAEYLVRRAKFDLDDEEGFEDIDDVDLNSDTFSLRVSYSF